MRLYHEFMKLFLLAALRPVLDCRSGADLGEFKTVYILPMSNGLDQFLAIKLTSGSVMQVVTDPTKPTRFSRITSALVRAEAG